MKNQLKYIIGCLIGNLLEWYDFILYGIFAGIIAHLFFPHSNSQIGLMATFTVLAVGYFTRPLGGILFGHFGDKFSRRQVLVFALLSMGVITTLIGLLPTYATWGIGATVLLILLRMLQGLAVGGEFAGSMVFLVESAPPKHRALISSLSFVGAMLGVLLATFVANITTSFFSQAGIYAGAWRIPFILGVVLAVLGAYLRIYLWQGAKPVDVLKVPLYHLLTQHFSQVLRCVAYLLMPAVFTGMTTVFLVPYFTHYYHLSFHTAVRLELLVSLVTLLSLPLAAYLADRHANYRRWLLWGMVVLIVVSYPLFVWMTTGFFATVTGFLIFVILTCIAMGPEVVFIADLFKKEMRYTGVGLSHGLAFSVITGTSPLVLNYLAYHFGVVAPSFYFILSAIIAWIAVFSTTAF